jgi:hypothetical protein
MKWSPPFAAVLFLFLQLTLGTCPARTQSLPDADSRLYNGLEYIRNGIAAKGFPFFDADSLRRGTLFYDSLLFDHIPMEYDLVEDKLIMPDFSGKALISLIPQKLDRFSIGGHLFRYVDADKTGSILHKTGFYEVLYQKGTSAVLARREKKLIFPSNREEQAHYDQSNTYFLALDGRYFSIDGKNGLIDALQDKKNELKQFIRTNRIRFNKKELETALIRITDYYLQIRH